MYEVTIILLAVHAVLTPTPTSTGQLPTGKCVHVTASAVLLNHIINYRLASQFGLYLKID